MTIDPDFQELQERLVASAPLRGVRSVLEMGTGTGETARRILGKYPRVMLVGVDASPQMLAVAKARLPTSQVTLIEQALEEPLPPGPFDLVVSALTVHHLGAADKIVLFHKVFNSLEPGGRFVLGDIFIAPGPPASARQRLSWKLLAHLRALGHRQDLVRFIKRLAFRPTRWVNGRDHVDRPDTVADESAWLELAGFEVQCPWAKDELAVLVAKKPSDAGLDPR